MYSQSGFYDDESALAAAFPAPVTQSLLRQTRLLVTEMTGRSGTASGQSPPMDVSLANVQGADVLLIFIESYGAVSWEHADLAGPNAQARANFENDIRETGRDVVSAFVESPTFGGNSWLAHISLLTGLEIRDEDANVLLMRQKRETLISTFARRGYRTMAMMPGLQQSWPEGIFYGFNAIYDGERLDYKGPPFGWWTIPDQFVAARLDAAEIEPRSRAPLFVFFPTTGTHTPFTPTAPYQPDWARMLTAAPVRTGRAPARVVATAGLDEPRAKLRACAGGHLQVDRRLAPQARRSRPRPDSDRRPPAAGARQRRRRHLGRAGSRDREPHDPSRGARRVAIARIP